MRLIFQELFTIGLVCVFAAWIGCPLYRLFGIPCPVCGMTRAYRSLLQGEIGQAFLAHPLFLLVPVMIVLFLFRKRIPKKMLQLGACFISALFLGVYFYRMLVLKSDIVQLHFEEGWISAMLLRIWEMLGGIHL